MTIQTERGQVLVAIMNSKADFSILQEQGWYRIPVAKAPRRWPPKWLAFYQTKIFGDEAFAVNYYGLVREIRIVRRREMFPNEIPSSKSDRQYYQVHLHNLEQLPAPILSRRWRRIVFIPTTWQKFSQTVEINDLFDEISALGGLVDEGLVPRVFYKSEEGLAQQLSLFDESTEYDLD